MTEPKKKKKRGRNKRRMPRRLKFTREGRVFVLATLGIGAAAVNTGNNLLYLVLGMMLSLIVLSGILSEVVLRHLKVERGMPRRAFAGSPSLFELRVKNDKRRAPSYSIELADVAPDAPTERRCYFLKVGPESADAAAYPRVPVRRGRLKLTEIVVRTRFPFGLFEKSRSFEIADELIVYPALAPDAPRPTGEGSTGRDVPTPRRGVGTEVSGLREYVAGDEARSIHWRRSASLGQTVVRDRQRDAARRVTLVIDEAKPEGAGEAWDEAFEVALSRVATAAQHALDRGAAVEAVARQGRSPLVLPGQPADPVWRFLALLEPTTKADAALDLADAGVVQRFEVGAAA